MGQAHKRLKKLLSDVALPVQVRKYFTYEVALFLAFSIWVLISKMWKSWKHCKHNQSCQKVRTAKSKRQHFDDIVSAGKLECKNWVKTKKEKETGSICFITKEDDHNEMVSFKGRKYKIVAMKLMVCCRCQRASGEPAIYLQNQRQRASRMFASCQIRSKEAHFFEVFEGLVINSMRKVMIQSHKRP